ncbi:MAG: hypothetical protein Kow00103_13740 [Candidatus Caldatribacteriota bacterium]
MSTNTSFNLSLLIGLMIIVLLFILFIQFKKGKFTPNYRLFFILGTTWTPLGVVFYINTKNYGFLVMGIIFLILGLANKDKWEETEPIATRQSKIIIGILAIGLLVLGLFLFRYLK